MTGLALHYFRLPPQCWSLYLTRLKQMGVSQIYSPVPWSVHEREPEQVDVTGFTHPRRNLLGFVQICRQMDFTLILDLTPSLPPDAAVLHKGIPGWLIKDNADLLLRSPENPQDIGLILEHPNTRTLVERWYRQLGQALNSSAVRVQINLSSLPPAHSEHVSQVQWPIWLRKQYAEGGVEALNTRYQSNFRRVSEVPLDATLPAQAFKDDVAAFSKDLNTHTQETYLSLLEKMGLEVISPMDAPPHAVKIMNDPADIGMGLSFAEDAPIFEDGRPAPGFAEIRNNRTFPVAVDETSETDPAYALYLNGVLVKSDSPKNSGLDFSFHLALTDETLPDDLAAYLSAIAASQSYSLRYAQQQLQTLLDALTPKLPPASAGTPGEVPPGTSTSIYEAQQGISDATRALQRAAASIGMLEDVFATALNKSSASPQESPAPSTLLTLNPAEFGPVRQACQQVLAGLQGYQPLSTPFTLAQYQHHTALVAQLAENASLGLADTLTWLRESLLLQEVSGAAWPVHNTLESVLQTLHWLQ